MIKTQLSAAVIALFALTAPIHASARADANVAPSRVVDASDLDLTTADGKAMFDHRIAIAVKAVCATDDTSDYASRAANRACRAHAQEAMITQRNAVIVAAAAVRAHALLAKN